MMAWLVTYQKKHEDHRMKPMDDFTSNMVLFEMHPVLWAAHESESMRWHPDHEYYSQRGVIVLLFFAEIPEDIARVAGSRWCETFNEPRRA